MLEMKSVLRDLCGAPGPAGFEGGAVSVAEGYLRAFTDDVAIDRLGNLTGFLPCGAENAKLVMLDAHLDEIGLMVTAFEEGYAQFRPLGGMDPRVFPAKTVRLLTEPNIFGVVACLPPHVQTAADMKKAAPLDKLYLDTGGVEVPPGTLGVFEAPGIPLGETQFTAKALDDRVCFAVLLRMLELLPAVEAFTGRKRTVDLLICGSVQEEVGGRGAQLAAFARKPDCAVAVDVAFGKSPDAPSDTSFKPGGGPVLTLGPECDRGLTDKLKAAAKNAKIPLQLEVAARDTGTNATEIMLVREGIPVAALGIPLKYMHTMAETVSLEDAEAAARLLAEWLCSLS